MCKTIKEGLLKFYQEKLPSYMIWGVVIIWVLLVVLFAIVIIRLQELHMINLRGSSEDYL